MLFPRNRSEQWYRDAYEKAEVLPEAQGLLQTTCDRIMLHKAEYELAVKDTAIPWEFPALLHCLEADNDMRCQFFNGAAWYLKITVWPKQTVGPWKNWQEAAHDALYGEVKGFPMFSGMEDWDYPRLFCRAECWNGPGYANMNLPSQYLLGLTNICVGVGKYVADGKYDPKAQTSDIGVIPLYKELQRRKALAATPAPAPKAQTGIYVSDDRMAAIEKAIADLVAAFKAVKS